MCQQLKTILKSGHSLFINWVKKNCEKEMCLIVYFKKYILFFKKNVLAYNINEVKDHLREYTFMTTHLSTLLKREL